MIIQTVLMGFVLATVPLDDLGVPGWHTTYYEGVVFEAWGMIEVDITGKGRHRLRWDTRHAGSWRNYLKAREELARTPVPYGVACSTPSSISVGSASPA